jgi:hypothetical protein
MKNLVSVFFSSSLYFKDYKFFLDFLFKYKFSVFKNFLIKRKLLNSVIVKNFFVFFKHFKLVNYNLKKFKNIGGNLDNFVIYYLN